MSFTNEVRSQKARGESANKPALPALSATVLLAFLARSGNSEPKVGSASAHSPSLRCFAELPSMTWSHSS